VHPNLPGIIEFFYWCLRIGFGGIILYALWWFGAFHAIRDSFSNARRRREQEQAKTLQRHKEAEREKERQAILADLPVVASMTATVKVEGTKVHVLVALSEAERAAVEQHELDDVLLESVPKYTRDQVDQRVQEWKDIGESMSRRTGIPSFSSDDLAQKRREYAAECNEISIGDILDPLNMRDFSTPREAMLYSEKLKKELLPKLKTVIDESLVLGDKTETIQF
jgi:hypothetical protein